MFNAYQLRGIAEDIEYFRDQWKDGATDAELRRGTTILRRLLIDGGNGMLLPAWRALGFEGQPTLPAYALPAEYLAHGRKVLLATAGGARANGVQIAAIVVAKERLERASQKPSPIRLTVAEFLAAPVTVGDGSSMTRREIIKFFANYLGGVHVGSRARRDDQALARKFARIEEIALQVKVLDKDLVHLELLAFGQSIGTSEDCQQLALKIRESAA